MITLKDLGKIYVKEGNVSNALSHIDLSFEQGEYVAITGKSGSGKSTLLNVLGGMDSYESGEMYIDGEPTSSWSKKDFELYNADKVSFIFQEYNILESFTVLENVEFALTSIKDIKERKKRALEIIDRVGLTDRINAKGGKLSGGEKQRTVIARAIAKDSPIILADEPTGNLDSKTAKDVLDLIKEMSVGKLVIMVTHNYDDVKEYVTRHIRLHDGVVELDERFDGKENNYSELASKDKYDFRDAHDNIFKQKSKAKKNGYTIATVHDIFTLGVRRFASRPKQSILISILMTISMIAILMVAGYLPSFMIQKDFGTNNMDGRVLVVNKDDTLFTEQTAKDLMTKSGADSYLLNDVILDMPACIIDISVLGEADDYYKQGLAGFQYVLDEYADIPKGEIDLLVPYGFQNDFREGQKVIVNVNTLIGYNGNIRWPDAMDNIITKIHKINYYVDQVDAVPKIIINRDFYDVLIDIYRYSNDMKLYHKDNGGIISQGIYTEISIQGLKFFDFSFSGRDVNYQNRKQPMSDFAFDKKGHRKANDRYLPYKYHMQYSESYFFGVDVFREMDLPVVKESSQISLFFSDENAKQAFLSAQSTAGYSAVDVNNKLSAIDVDPMEILLMVVTIIAVVLICLTIDMVLVLTLKRLIYATKGDIAIFRTMGIDPKIVKKSTYVQLFLALVPAVAITMCVMLVFMFTFIGKGFIMSVASGMIVLLGGLILMLAVGRSYNKVLYQERIKKNLRRVNK